jgi:hypothetical protein
MRDDQDPELNRHFAFSNADHREGIQGGGKYQM